MVNKRARLLFVKHELLIQGRRRSGVSRRGTRVKTVGTYLYNNNNNSYIMLPYHKLLTCTTLYVPTPHDRPLLFYGLETLEVENASFIFGRGR
jgi:hypothetical protein